MTSGREILLGDARRGIERQLTAASEVDLADIGFAAWLLGWNDSPFDIAGATKAAIEHRTRGYRDVAALGFLAELTSPACTFRDELKEGLSWLSNRPTTIVGTVAGFVSDAVGLLGIALGASHCGEAALEKAVGTWLESVCTARKNLPDFEPWESCLFAAAVQRLGKPELVAVSGASEAADCRIALRSLGALPEVYPADAQADENNFLSSLLTDEIGELEFVKAVLKAAAYDAIKRSIVGSGGRGAISAATNPTISARSNQTAKKVFVSYSWEPDDPEHQPRVLRFTQDLRRYGIDATMDLFEQHPAEGLPAWMIKQIRNSDFVLMVITETYRRRFEGDEEFGQGKGVKWEGGIITRAIYEAEFLNRKFVPILFGAKHKTSIPTVLVGGTHYDVTDLQRLEDLVRYMTDQPAYIPAPLGPAPILPPRNDRGAS